MSGAGFRYLHLAPTAWQRGEGGRAALPTRPTGHRAPAAIPHHPYAAQQHGSRWRRRLANLTAARQPVAVMASRLPCWEHIQHVIGFERKRLDFSVLGAEKFNVIF